MAVFNVLLLVLAGAPIVVRGQAEAPTAAPGQAPDVQNIPNSDVPTAPLNVVSPNASTSLPAMKYVMGEFGTIPYGHHIQCASLLRQQSLAILAT